MVGAGHPGRAGRALPGDRVGDPRRASCTGARAGVGPVEVDSLLARKHREHHADPRDIPLVFIPWQALVWLLPAYVVVALLAMPTLPSALSLLVSVYAIKFGYEWTHYLVHSDYRPQSRWFRSVWRNHRLHHYKNEHYWFTVTTAGTADRLFGTYPDPATVADLAHGQAAARDRGRPQPRHRRLVTVHHLNCATMRPAGSLGGRVSPGAAGRPLPARRARRRAAAGRHRLRHRRPRATRRGWAGRSAPSCGRRSTRPRPRGPRSWRSATGSRTSPTSCSPTSTSTTPAASATSRRPGSTCSATSSTPRCAQRCASRPRYVAAQWAHGPRWQRHEVAGEDWFGFGAVTALDDDVLLVPLRGHTRGHCGVAVRRPDGRLAAPRRRRLLPRRRPGRRRSPRRPGCAPSSG